MAIPVLGEIERWITEHGSATILKEHLALLQTKISTLKEEVTKLERENTALRTRNAELEAQVATTRTAEEFVEEMGALFKRKPGGGYQRAVYCPRCRLSTAPFPEWGEYNCKCGWSSSFQRAELDQILQALPA
jgi:FtsZ-binding cell division protein ZapB